jgi:hypothetical protein
VSGCKVKSLPCKIWFCGFMKDRNPDLGPLIAKWNEEIKALPGMFFFQSREDYQQMLENKF